MLGTVKSVDLNPLSSLLGIRRGAWRMASSQAVGREPRAETKSGMLGQSAAVTRALLTPADRLVLADVVSSPQAARGSVSL